MNCPVWSDVDEHQSPACYAAIRDVVRSACGRARRLIPEEQEILRWHREAFRSLVPLDYYAGNFRQDDPKRECLARDVQVDRVPGVPFPYVIIAMRQLADFIRERMSSLEVQWDLLSPDVRLEQFAKIVGTAVGTFVRIHPFINGNGRTSRILWTALFYRIGLPSHITVVKRPAPPYGDVMKKSMVGDYGPAILLVLSAIANAPAVSRQGKLPLPSQQTA